MEEVYLIVFIRNEDILADFTVSTYLLYAIDNYGIEKGAYLKHENIIHIEVLLPVVFSVGWA